MPELRRSVTIAYDPDAISDPTQRISDTSTTETNPNYLLGFVEAIQNNSTQQLTDTTPLEPQLSGQTLTLSFNEPLLSPAIQQKLPSTPSMPTPTLSPSSPTPLAPVKPLLFSTTP